MENVNFYEQELTRMGWTVQPAQAEGSLARLSATKSTEDGDRRAFVQISDQGGRLEVMPPVGTC
jgi:hypothetical protein